MRFFIRTAAICLATALAGCFQNDAALSQDDEKLFEAVVYLFTGLEDNLAGLSENSTAWQRELKGRTLDYWSISRNGFGFSDDETNKKVSNSKHVRYVFRLTSPEPCTFTFEHLNEFSKGDSREDFSVYVLPSPGDNLTLRFANAHMFQMVDDGYDVYVRIVGPRVVCTGDGYCENAWNSVNSGLSLGRFYGKDHKDRREKALAIIKKACPGKEF